MERITTSIGIKTVHLFTYLKTDNMKMILTNAETLQFIHSALCNGGLNELNMCGVVLDVSDEDYAQAREKLKQEDICMEDVRVQILRSKKPLEFYDREGQESLQFTLEDAKKRLSTEDALEVLLAYKNENDDSETGWQLLQYCLYGEVIFG